MARDVLAVPISSVASESAFSNGGRVLSNFRSSLTPAIVEALICAEDWLRVNGGDGGDEDDFEEDQEIEDDCFAAFYNDNHTGDDPRAELVKYLAEAREVCSTDKKQRFDVLAYWKASALRFPILSEMARDVLAVPISSAASESAFSNGGRVLSNFRSSLTPAIVEALICAEDWLRSTSPKRRKMRMNNLSSRKLNFGIYNLYLPYLVDSIY
ncbi:Putative AC9 transposase [Linum perenne]